MTAINEDKLKKNTDCVYFLASPLTCKKRNDCEFRHSETARFNPRDCWFWSAGKCVKINCPFRHLPLECLSAIKSATVRKHRSPCFYFAQGFCSKGETCIFMHELPPGVGNSTAHLASKSTTMPQSRTKLSNDDIDYTDEYKSIGIVDSEPPLRSKVADGTSLIEFAALKDDAKISSPKACLSAELHDDKITDALSRMPATPARGGSHESVSGSSKPKQVAVTRLDASSNQVYTEDKLGMLPSEADAVQRVHSPENRLYDRNDSEDLHDKTSFDVLVNDARANQVEYLDTSYRPSCDAPMDKLKGSTQRGALQGQDLVHYDYGHYYEQKRSPYYEFEARNMYDPVQQHSYYDHMSTIDYHVGSTFRGSVPNMINEQNIASGEENLRTEDLRHHLVKRRREERSHSFEENHSKRQHAGFLRSGFQHHHNNSHQHGTGYQEEWIRGSNAPDAHNNVRLERSRSRLNSNYFQPDFNKERLHHETPYFHATSRKDYSLLDAEGSASGRAYHRRRDFERWEHSRNDPDFEGPKPLSVLLKKKHRKLASAEAERGERRLKPSHDLDGPKQSLKEMHTGTADRDFQGASTSREVISLHGESQEKNAINRNSDPMKINKAKSDHCLRKMKDTNISSYLDVDTELSLSLSCPREDHISSVDD